MIHSIGNLCPQIHPSVFVAWNAEVAGDVIMEEEASVWFSVTLRADIASIRIGQGTNIQDGSVLHVDTDLPLVVGSNVTVGHRVILHACTVGDGALIGMGAVVLNGAEIGSQSIVGAGALVTQGKKFPSRSLILGSPAKFVRELTEQEVDDILRNSKHYVDLAKEAKEGYKQV